ncbi:MAG TPA: GNAT family N-acetyltransferase [Candidatus Krumholzibacteria bacterium]|nr:GNAT family N-acetyltransferase [Candidatus Krumholzibacteria bacterium]
MTEEHDTPTDDRHLPQLTLRRTEFGDYDDIHEIMHRVYPHMGPWEREVFARQLEVFPEGQLCIETEGKVVAAAISMIVDYDRYGHKHTYWQIIGDGALRNHDPDGDTLYGVDVFVHPDYRELRLARRLYDARKELCVNLNLKQIVLGGRIPGYRALAHEMTPQQYIEEVRHGERMDPVLTFQLNNEFQVARVVRNYLPEDRESGSTAVVLTWPNIWYEDEDILVGGRRKSVRVGVLQWQMRRVKNVDDLMEQAEYFVDAVAGYNADFVLFPEFFSAPLMAGHGDQSPAEAIRSLADYSAAVRDRLLDLALGYNVNVICGSMPLIDDEGGLRNASFLCRRDGTWDAQYKLHITPDEVHYWGLQGGSRLLCFDTDAGKIGILVCYDVEFPELPRLLAEQGMEILFVPYWTDTKNAYLRVRRCAQARAIENECYVVISGSVGNLPQVENMDIQYSQSAVFSPSDFAFAHDAIVAEATPNTEMPLIVDLDLDKLRQLRVRGSVRNLADRRRDLYRVRWVGPDGLERGGGESERSDDPGQSG